MGKKYRLEKQFKLENTQELKAGVMAGMKGVELIIL